MAQAANGSDGESIDRAATPRKLAPWTRRIVAGEATITDVPERDRRRIAREVKSYANHFPDIGESATVERLIDDLKQAEVGVDGR